MAPTAETVFEVWGDPVEHSLSPVLHRAAYSVLGLPWTYRYRRVTEELLASTWAESGSQLGGISLTMPLKERILQMVTSRDPIVDTVNAANTVYRMGESHALSNTDPFGVERALDHFGVDAEHAWVLGAGATARSVAHALARRGTRDLTVFARDTERAGRSVGLMKDFGLSIRLRSFGELGQALPPQLVASTLPGSAEGLPRLPGSVMDSAALFDVAYSPWPSHYAQAWSVSRQPVVSGLWMLVFQALAQIRLFVHADVSRELSNEGRVVDAMLEAVGLPTG